MAEARLSPAPVEVAGDSSHEDGEKESGEDWKGRAQAAEELVPRLAAQLRELQANHAQLLQDRQQQQQQHSKQTSPKAPKRPPPRRPVSDRDGTDLFATAGSVASI